MTRQRGTLRAGSPSCVLGVPVVPPAWASSGLTRLRSGLSWLHGATAPPPLRIVETMLGSLDPVALAALCELGIPDHLDAPLTVSQLATRIGADEARLQRLVRYCAARGFLRLDRGGRVRASRVTRFLRSDHPGGWRAWVDFAQAPEVVASLQRLGRSVGVGQDAFMMANGDSFFDRAGTDAVFGSLFDAAMAAGGRLHGLALAAALDWTDDRRVADIGGGTGALLGELVERVPHLVGTLFDLPMVIERAEATAKVDTVAGDAFAGVPGDCDVYLLVNVLHDWPDPDAVRLLRRVATDSPPGARVIVVEGERRARPADELAAKTDLLMLALTSGGHERTRAEFVELGQRAGLTFTRAVPLSSADWAFEFQRSATAR